MRGPRGRRVAVMGAALTAGVLAALLAGSSVAGTVSLAAGGADEAPAAQGDGAAHAERTLARLVNEYRAGHGLGALRASDPLARASRLHAGNLAATGTLTHVLDGAGPAERARAQGFEGPVAENLAEGEDGTAAALFELWISSEAHRANLLGAGYREVGIGCARRALDRRLYCVAMFGVGR